MLLRVRTTAFLSGAAIAGAFAVFKLRQDLLDSQEVLLDQVRQSETQSLSGSVGAWSDRGIWCTHCLRKTVLLVAVMPSCMPSFGGLRAS